MILCVALSTLALAVPAHANEMHKVIALNASDLDKASNCSLYSVESLLDILWSLFVDDKWMWTTTDFRYETTMF